MRDGGSSRADVVQQAARYGAVTGAGFVLDVALLWMLGAVLAVPLALAAGIAVVTAGAMNYVLHESWTFGSDGQRARFSALRAGKFGGVVAATAVVRSTVIVLLTATTNADALISVIIAIAASYVVGFVLSRTLVFRWKRTVGG